MRAHVFDYRTNPIVRPIVIDQRSRSRFFRVHDAAVTRGLQLAMSKAWRSCLVFVLVLVSLLLSLRLPGSRNSLTCFWTKFLANPKERLLVPLCWPGGSIVLGRSLRSLIASIFKLVVGRSSGQANVQPPAIYGKLTNCALVIRASWHSCVLLRDINNLITTMTTVDSVNTDVVTG